jgi:hypothetical protein
MGPQGVWPDPGPQGQGRLPAALGCARLPPQGWLQAGRAPATRRLPGAAGQGAGCQRPAAASGRDHQPNHPCQPVLAAQGRQTCPGEANQSPARARANLPRHPAANRNDFPSSGPGPLSPIPFPQDDSHLGLKLALIPVWHQRPPQPTDGRGQPSDPIVVRADRPPRGDHGAAWAFALLGAPDPTPDPNPCLESFF